MNFSHRQLVLHTLAVAATLRRQSRTRRFHRGDVYMPITPMFHVHAWGFPYIATMLGVKQVYPGRYTPELLVRLFTQEKVTFSHCVPTLLHMLLTCPAGKGMDMRGWKVVIGGSALSNGLAIAALERGIDVFAGYGMSETCPVLTLAHLPPDWRCKIAEAHPLQGWPRDPAGRAAASSARMANDLPSMANPPEKSSPARRG